MTTAIEQVRTQLGDEIRALISGSREPRQPSIDTNGDTGWFGPDSATWAVHSDIAMLVGGVSSLLYQTLHPLAMAGVADHSTYRSDPLGRLHRTANFVGTTTFGSTKEADAAIAMVKRIHRKVKGTAPDGRAYSARDPHLLSWVHCTEVASFLRANQKYAAHPVPVERADEYVAEMARVARGLGLNDPPLTVTELNQTLHDFRPELTVNRQGRDAIRFLVWPPKSPIATRLPYSVLVSAAVALLPRHARILLRLPVLPLAEPLAIRPAATVLLRTMGWALNPQAEN